MEREPTNIAGVYIIRTTPFRDMRGTFERVFCQREFAAWGLETEIAQWNMSRNPHRGTLRGLHLQDPPHQEAKLVHCVVGRIFDVAVDLRPTSETFGRHFCLELSAEDSCSLYLPQGCAHGYQTLEDATTVVYQVSAFHSLSAETGVRWDDPDIGVRWPLRSEAIVSDRDRNLPVLAHYRSRR